MRAHAIDLVSKLLVYPPEGRLSTQDALSHPFLTCDEVPLLLPPEYPLQEGQEEWEGLSLGDLVKRVLALDNERGSENNEIHVR